ncbi:hypothetical protein M0R45_033154 [Rubus argutus]|uniref:ATP-dependent RNA helicase n=1 Tax=Rubus argutus TaxID=59490 RepID=A0AAW1WJQ2_RUBAR
MTTVKREETVNLIPAKYKDCYLTYILRYNHNCSAIVFARTSETACTLALMLSNLGMSALLITDNMSKSQRSGVLDMFFTNLIYPSCGSVLVCTDVVSRELEIPSVDIPSVDIIVNYDIPSNSQNYIHSVGRATQAGRCGLAISLVSQCEVEKYIKIEKLIGKDFPEFPSFSKDEAIRTFDIVTQAKRNAVMEIEIIRDSKCMEEMKMMMILESRL